MNILDQNLSSLDEIKHELEQIKFYLEKMKLELLTNKEYRHLQFLLIKHESCYRSYSRQTDPYPLCKTSIKEDKIMFISDTHFGDPSYENKDLVYRSYNIALKQNIKSVVHLGDLIEACCLNYKKDYETVLNELNIALCNMPNEISTKLLLGNHDYSAIRTHTQIIDDYFSDSKLDILGMNKVLLNWNGQANICLSHPISQLKSPKTKEYEETFTIEGHHHLFKIREHECEIYLPSLSKYALQSYTINSYLHPLFLIASKQDENNILFEINGINQPNDNIQSLKVVEINTKTKKLKLYKE